MNGKELTASFWKGVKTARELKMLSSGWNPSTKQKVQIRKVVVLCDAEYKRYMDGELDQPKIFLAEDKERLRYDTRHHTWNCLLVVGESSKDGILAGYLPKSDSLFLTYVPEHRELELPEGIVSDENIRSVTLSFDTTDMTERSFNVSQISVINVPANYQIVPTTKRINNVVLVGPQEDLEQLSAGSIEARINAEDLQVAVGTQTVAVQILVPSNPRVFAIGTYTVQCNITSR